MSLGSLPASRVALYALVWLVGFPLVMGIADVFTPYELHGYPDTARVYGVASGPVSVQTQVKVVDTFPLASRAGGQAVMLSVVEEERPVDWVGWFLPPALFVGVWALARRRRTDGD